MNTDKLNIIDAGLTKYGATLEQQLSLFSRRRDGEIGDTVIVVEHEAVITLGVQKKLNKLLMSAEMIRAKGIDVVEIRRGGGPTAHNPGQLVIYPIINLIDRDLTISEYVLMLESMGQEILSQVSVDADVKKGFPGLWVGDRKIGSVGVRVSRGTTYHGIAINIANDLSIFEMFVPCGIEGVEITSAVNELKMGVDFNKIKKNAVEIITKYFANNERVENETSGQASGVA